MSHITVLLPDAELERFVHQVVEKDALGGPDEYVLNLIRDDRRRRAKKRIEALLLEGLDSELIEVDEKFWAEMRRELEEKYPPGS